jgi:hypothetical protein
VIQGVRRPAMVSEDANSWGQDEPRRLRDRTTVITPAGALGRLAGKVTGRVVETVDLEVLLDRVDLDALLDRIDVDRILDRVDVDRILDRVDVDRLIGRVDLDRLIDRFDLNRMLAAVDVDALLRDLDVESLVQRLGVPGIVVESHNRLAGSLLDLIRRQLAGLDVVLDRIVNRLLRRDATSQPAGPRGLAELEER